MKKRRISLLLFLLLLSSLFFPGKLGASLLDQWQVSDGVARWAYFSSANRPHMAKKSTSYKFQNSTVLSKYQSLVESGINLWGSTITCTYNPSSTTGLIDTISGNQSYTALATISSNLTTRHITSWKITIASATFDPNTTAGKIRTIAHEIGHVYGLGHVSHTTQIMYGTYSASKNVTVYDRNGMNVMTHTDTHPTRTLEQGVNFHHYTRCNTCKAALINLCSHEDYHIGTRHHFKANCSCGNTYQTSWSCSGNPHSFPY